MNDTQNQAGERTQQPIFGKGCIGIMIDGSSDSADYINRATIEFAQAEGFKTDLDMERDAEDDSDFSQFLSETADQAIDFLNGLELLPYCFFTFEDNSLFYLPDVNCAKDDGVGFVSSRANEYPADDYEGEWLHVSDHGNATLYIRENGQDKEIWGGV